MTRNVANFLHFLAIVDGRSRQQIASALACSLAQVKRLMTAARESGVSVESIINQHEPHIYRVTDYGPFDVQKLRQLPWRTMGRKG